MRGALSRLSSVIGILAGNAVIAQDCLDWVKVSDGAPASRFGHTMFANTATNRVMLFSSGGLNTVAGDNWEWDSPAGTWAKLESENPDQDQGLYAWDQARQRVVLFGSRYPIPGARTWEWDGTAWSLKSSSGPGQRPGANMVWDESSGRVVLYDGAATTSLRETWEWDGTTWMLRATAGPATFQRSPMVFEPGRGRVLVLSASGSELATWEWDTTAGEWVQLASNGPSARTSFVLAFDPTRGRILLSGGQPPAWGIKYPLDDLWEWRASSREWHQLPFSMPEGRRDHAMSTDPATGNILIFSGRPFSILFLVTDNLWALDPSDQWHTLN